MRKSVKLGSKVTSEGALYLVLSKVWLPNQKLFFRAKIGIKQGTFGAGALV